MLNIYILNNKQHLCHKNLSVPINSFAQLENCGLADGPCKSADTRPDKSATCHT